MPAKVVKASAPAKVQPKKVAGTAVKASSKKKLDLD